jgi:predicted nucleic acid-binding protein
MTAWLFDTTFILPFFGIDVAIPDLRDQLKSILSTRQLGIFISSCSLIEAKWNSIRQYQKTRDKDYLDGANQALASLQANKYMKIVETWFVKDANAFADELLLCGHRDYMDCWIAATAKVQGLVLVSEDKNLKELITEKTKWTEFRMVNWEEFLEEIKVSDS